MKLITSFMAVIFIIGVVVTRPIFGAENAKPFKSLRARKARSKYDAALTRLFGTYVKDFEKITVKYLDELKATIKPALVANQLDEAQNIARAVKELQTYLDRQRTQPGTAKSGLAVLDARWGAYDGWINVTERVRASVRKGRLAILHAGAGYKDPKFGHQKSLVIVYRYRGRIHTTIVPSSRPVSLP